MDLIKLNIESNSGLELYESSKCLLQPIIYNSYSGNC